MRHSIATRVFNVCHIYKVIIDNYYGLFHIYLLCQIMIINELVIIVSTYLYIYIYSTIYLSPMK